MLEIRAELKLAKYALHERHETHLFFFDLVSQLFFCCKVTF